MATIRPWCVSGYIKPGRCVSCYFKDYFFLYENYIQTLHIKNSFNSILMGFVCITESSKAFEIFLLFVSHQTSDNFVNIIVNSVKNSVPKTAFFIFTVVILI